MAESKVTKKDVFFSIKIVVGILILMVLYGGSMFFYGNTLVEWWTPLSMALGVGLLSWFMLRRCWISLWKDINVFLLLFGHLVFMTGFALFVILGCNYFLADDSTLHSEEVTVESRLRETHYHSKRVGRRRYRQGDPYYEYYLRVVFADGRKKDINVSLKRYNRTRTGSVITLELENGFLGYPVIKSRL